MTIYCGVHSLRFVVPPPPEQQIYTRRHAQNKNDIVIRGCATVLTSQWIIGLQSEKSNFLLKVIFFQSCVYYATVNLYRMREYPGTTKAMLCSHFVYLSPPANCLQKDVMSQLHRSARAVAWIHGCQCKQRVSDVIDREKRFGLDAISLLLQKLCGPVLLSFNIHILGYFTPKCNWNPIPWSHSVNGELNVHKTHI